MDNIIDDLIKCKLCNKKFSKLGMVSHVTRKHKIKYSDYNVRKWQIVERINGLMII